MISMIGCWIASIIGIGLILAGIVIAFLFWSYEKEFLAGVAALLFMSCMGFVILIIPSFGRWRDAVYTYEKPAFVIKTNNITTVAYMREDGIIYSERYDTAGMWNATNIVVKKTSGKNFFNYPLEGYDIGFEIR